jgi:predicted permease
VTGPVPAFAVWLVRLAVRPELADDVLGDLEATWRAETSRWAAHRRVFAVAVSVAWHGWREGRLGRPSFRATADDVAMAFKSVVRRPRLSASAALTLAIGLAASTAVLTMARSVFEGALPYPDSNNLVHVYASWPGGFGNLSYPDFAAMRAATPALDDLAIYETWGSIGLGGGDRPVALTPTFVSPRYLPLLGATAELGRLFDASELGPAADGTVVISDGLWRRRFGADPQVIGSSVSLNGRPFRVIGVMRASFTSLTELGEKAPDIWLPVAAAEPLLGQAPITQVARIFWVLGHRAPGASIDLVRQQLDAVAARLARERPATHAGYRLEGQSLVSFLNGAIERPSRVLAAGAILMLLIGCANVANLLLARATERRGEFAMRVALGASRGQIVRQTLIEGAIVAAAGGVTGLIAAAALIRVLAPFVETHISPFVSVSGSVTAAGIAAALAIVAALLVGLAPAFAATRVDLVRAAALTGRGQAAPGRHRVRGGIVIAEVAVSVVLLVGVGLLGRSLQRLLTSGVGFPTERLLTFRMDLTGDRYVTDQSRIAFSRSFVEHVQASPAVASATIWGPSMLGRATWVTSVLPEDRPWSRPEDFVQGSFHLTSPDGLQHLGIAVLAGRDIGAIDTPTNGPVAVISESVVRRFWPDQPLAAAIGRRLRRPNPALPFFTVIGVAADARHRNRYSLGDIAQGIGALGLSDQRDLYLPYVQRPVHAMTAAVRLRGDASTLADVRQAVAAVDSDLPLEDVQMLDQRLAEQSTGLRALATVMAVFSAMAVVLAGVGLYGALANVVHERTREIGVRMALGARRGSVRRWMLGVGGGLVVPGVLIGLAIATGLSFIVRSLLYGVAPLDPLTFGGSAAMVLGMAFIAVGVPVARAARIDPIVALRDQ